MTPKPQCAYNSSPAGRAFTLVEILVVIAIIGILASMLLPVLSKARAKARKVKCISNQRQIYVAYTMYADENKDWYPVVTGSAGAGGKQGTFTVPPTVARLYGAAVPEKQRPLNQHLDNPEIFKCPSDIGGGAYNVESCFDAFGSSYQPQVADDMFRVKRVLGEATERPNSYEGMSINTAEIALSSVNKIIQGDWNWPYDGEDCWHSEGGTKGHVMLFGDSHVEFFSFPPNMTNWFLNPKPDHTFKWW